MNWLSTSQYLPMVDKSKSGIYRSASELVEAVCDGESYLARYVHYRYVGEGGKMQSRFFWETQSGKLIKPSMWRLLDDESRALYSDNTERYDGSGIEEVASKRVACDEDNRSEEPKKSDKDSSGLLLMDVKSCTPY